jgi:hypothetical protein
MSNLILKTENGLSVKENEAVLSLAPTLQKYYLARQSEKIISIDKKTALKAIYEIISKAMLNNGSTTLAGQEDAILFVCNEVYGVVYDKFKGLTIEEFGIAVKNGTIGDYGETFGVNLKTIVQWIKGYQSDERKKLAYDGVNHVLKLAQSRIYTEAEKFENIKQSTIRAYNDFKENSFLFPIFPAPYYDFLKEIGLINYSKDVKLDIAERAKKEYETNVLTQKKERRVKASEVASLLINLNENRSFVNICKKIALLKYFTELKKKGESIEGLINGI